MTVWQSPRALLGHAVRGRGHQRLYVILDVPAPEATRDQVTARSWTIVETYPPTNSRDRFVVATARPAPRR